MSITSLATIITLPEKCPMQEVQGIMVDVYEAKEVNGKPKQDFYLKDASGTRVKGAAWGHDDISFYKGKEVIIKCGAKGGLSVNNWQGKPGFSVSASCTFQSIAGGSSPVAAPAATTTPTEAQKPANAPQTASAGVSGVRPIPGVTVGMAVNNACASLTEAGVPLSKGAIWKTASMIIKVAAQLEQGVLHEESTAKAAAPAEPAKAEEDVPYEPAEQAPKEPEGDTPF